MSLTPRFDSGSPEDEVKNSEQAGQNKTMLWALLAVALVIGCGEGIYAVVLSHRLERTEQALQMQISKQDETVLKLTSRLGMTEDQFADLQGDLTSTKTHLDKTQLDVRKAHQVADQL